MIGGEMFPSGCRDSKSCVSTPIPLSITPGQELTHSVLYSTHCFSPSILKDKTTNHDLRHFVGFRRHRRRHDRPALSLLAGDPDRRRALITAIEEFMDGFGRSNAEILPIIYGPELPPAGDFPYLRRQRSRLPPTGPGQDDRPARRAGLAGPFPRRRCSPNHQLVRPHGQHHGDGGRPGHRRLFLGLCLRFPPAQGQAAPGYLPALRGRGEVAPSACVVFEDSIHGVEAARRAGMGCVALGERMVAALPTIVADGLGTPIVAVNSLTDLSWEQFVSLTQPG